MARWRAKDWGTRASRRKTRRNTFSRSSAAASSSRKKGAKRPDALRRSSSFALNSTMRPPSEPVSTQPMFSKPTNPTPSRSLPTPVRPVSRLARPSHHVPLAAIREDGTAAGGELEGARDAQRYPTSRPMKENKDMHNPYRAGAYTGGLATPASNGRSRLALNSFTTGSGGPVLPPSTALRATVPQTFHSVTTPVHNSSAKTSGFRPLIATTISRSDAQHRPYVPLSSAHSRQPAHDSNASAASGFNYQQPYSTNGKSNGQL